MRWWLGPLCTRSTALETRTLITTPSTRYIGVGNSKNIRPSASHRQILSQEFKYRVELTTEVNGTHNISGVCTSVVAKKCMHN